MLLTPPPPAGFAYGRQGGSIVPYAVAIAASGRVTTTGPAPTVRHKLTKQQLATLERAVTAARFATLPARTMCPGTLPDIADEMVRVGRRTVRVHGTCVARFNRLFDTFSRVTAAS